MRPAFLAISCAALLTAGCADTGRSAASQAAAQRPVVTMRGKPVTLEGSPVRTGQAAPDFTAVANDMSDKKLSDWRGKTVILSTVPSLETAVCDKETRTFNQRAAELGDRVVVLTVSMDLPMTQKKWCGAAGIDRVVTLSDYKDRQVGERYGLRIRESGLLARAVTVIDPAGVVRYQQIVPELATEPDYDAALAAARAAGR
ncbi:MAG TPA: thiol peroxidase [Phycisphaerales bacterium]|nr:thiol peroxidase [Phycisphaerales bacterium]